MGRSNRALGDTIEGHLAIARKGRWRKYADLLDRSTIDPAINHGTPVIRSLRYPVEALFELLRSGTTTNHILADYEDLEREHLLVAFVLSPD